MKTNTNNESLPCNYMLQGPSVIRIKEEDIPYTFFSSDLHVNHKNILNFTSRGQIWNDRNEMFLGLMDHLKSVLIPASDTAKDNNAVVRYIHCGDLIFVNSRHKSNEILKDIQSNISPYVSEVYAVFGNHDIDNILKHHNLIPCVSYQTTKTYCDNKWFWNNVYVVEVYRQTKCILRFTVSHFPMDEYYGCFNIHGHLHSEPGEVNCENRNNKDVIEKYRATGTHFDCGADNNHYKPVSLADILEGKTSINVNEIGPLKNMNFKYHRDDE